MSAEYSADPTEQERREAKAYLDYLYDTKISHAEVIERYDSSVDKYEKEMTDINYNAPTETAASVAMLYLNTRQDVNILDVAAGTGLCAVELLKHGFKKMDAFDASKPMLEDAKKKGLYGRYMCGMLGDDSLDINDDTYDVVTVCGMTTPILRSLPIKALEELIRVLKPGGYVVITGFHTTFEDSVETKDFKQNMKTLECRGKWKPIDVRRFKGYLNGIDGGVSVHKVC